MSELGHSLMTIQKLLQRNQTQELKQKDVTKNRELKIEKQSPNQQIIAANARLLRKIRGTKHLPLQEQSPLDELQKGIGSTISDLLKPEHPEDITINYELLREAHKKRSGESPKSKIFYE